MRDRVITAVLTIMTLAMFAGVVISFIALVAPSGCSDDDIGCSAASGGVQAIAGGAALLFAVLSLLSWWARQGWRDRRELD
jgi:hypothetical protein